MENTSKNICLNGNYFHMSLRIKVISIPKFFWYRPNDDWFVIVIDYIFVKIKKWLEIASSMSLMGYYYLESYLPYLDVLLPLLDICNK